MWCSEKLLQPMRGNTGRFIDRHIFRHLSNNHSKALRSTLAFGSSMTVWGFIIPVAPLGKAAVGSFVVFTAAVLGGSTAVFATLTSIPAYMLARFSYRGF
ncbi:MAG: hypothetical protein HC848_07815 [Limnobacter sp.]|nr:hypothetical protein [Limnobacter sp.]